MFYYDNLMRIRQNNDLDQWFKFFLVGVTETAQKSITKFDNIMQLQKHVKDKIHTPISRTANAQKVLNFLYQHPLITASVVGSVTGLTPASSYNLINDFIKLELLREIAGVKRGKVFVFEKYLSLFYQ